MEDSVKAKYFFLGVGSLLVALSGTIVGKYGFEGSISKVFVGYMIFVVAYKTCWYGNHQEEGFRDFVHLVEKSSKKSLDFFSQRPLNYFMIIVGLYFSSYGTVAFVEMVETPTLMQGIKTGLTSFGGYIIAHEGVNEVPI